MPGGRAPLPGAGAGGHRGRGAPLRAGRCLAALAGIWLGAVLLLESRAPYSASCTSALAGPAPWRALSPARGGVASARISAGAGPRGGLTPVPGGNGQDDSRYEDDGPEIEIKSVGDVLQIVGVVGVAIFLTFAVVSFVSFALVTIFLIGALGYLYFTKICEDKGSQGAKQAGDAAMLVLADRLGSDIAMVGTPTSSTEICDVNGEVESIVEVIRAQFVAQGGRGSGTVSVTALKPYPCDNEVPPLLAELSLDKVPVELPVGLETGRVPSEAEGTVRLAIPIWEQEGDVVAPSGTGGAVIDV